MESLPLKETIEALAGGYMTLENADVLIRDWYVIDKQLRELKAKEMELRLKIRDLVFNGTTDAGTHNYSLSEGYRLKLECKDNYTLTNANHETENALKEFHEVARATLVKWKPELSISAYKKLSPDEQKHFSEALTIKPGTPSLEIVEPKK